MAETTNPPRGRGRPRAEEPHTSLSVWMKSRDYDRIVKLAQQQEKSLSAAARDLLIVRLK